MTSVVGSGHQPLGRLQTAECRRAQHDAGNDQVQLGPPPAGRPFAGQPPADGPTRPQEGSPAPYGRAHRELPETVDRGNRRAQTPGRDNREHRVDPRDEDHPERHRLDGGEQDVVDERLPGRSLHEADPAPVVLQVEEDDPRSHRQHADAERVLTDDEEGRTHGGNDAGGHQAERDVGGEPAPNVLVLLVPAHVTHDRHRVSDHGAVQRREQDPDGVGEGEGPETGGTTDASHDDADGEIRGRRHALIRHGRGGPIGRATACGPQGSEPRPGHTRYRSRSGRAGHPLACVRVIEISGGDPRGPPTTHRA